MTSPVYMENVSGILKIFLDRTCKWFHRPELFSKPILVIATTKGSGLKSTLRYLERVVIQWGGFNAGIIGRSIRNIDNKVEVMEVKKFIFINYMPKKIGLSSIPFESWDQLESKLEIKFMYKEKQEKIIG